MKNQVEKGEIWPDTWETLFLLSLSGDFCFREYQPAVAALTITSPCTECRQMVWVGAQSSLDPSRPLLGRVLHLQTVSASLWTGRASLFRDQIAQHSAALEAEPVTWCGGSQLQCQLLGGWDRRIRRSQCPHP